ncbi:putative histidine kinase 4 [Hordeum vulgare]|nr:putative histidine kinase 4 [Hordeum vulgare]
MGMGVGGGEAGAAVAVGEEGKEEEDGGKGWRAKSKLSAAVAMVGVALAAGVERGAVLVLHRSRRHNGAGQAEEGIVCMCEERARMLQDQFAVSVNLVATFHYEKQRPALDQDLLIRLKELAAHTHLPNLVDIDTVGSRYISPQYNFFDQLFKTGMA